jgi:uncharacterized protein YaaQ
MKLIFAIISDDDAHTILDETSSNGIKVTKLCSTGGFLKSGNTTLLIGIEDHLVDKALEIIKKNARSRTQPLHHSFPMGIMPGMKTFDPYHEVSVGGATVFIIDIDRYERF